MRCHLHSGELIPCPICGGMDAYIADPSVKREDVEAHGAWFWYHHAGFWMDKFMEADSELKAMREVQTNQEDR